MDLSLSPRFGVFRVKFLSIHLIRNLLLFFAFERTFQRKMIHKIFLALFFFFLKIYSLYSSFNLQSEVQFLLVYGLLFNFFNFFIFYTGYCLYGLLFFYVNISVHAWLEFFLVFFAFKSTAQVKTVLSLLLKPSKTGLPPILIFGSHSTPSTFVAKVAKISPTWKSTVSLFLFLSGARRRGRDTWWEGEIDGNLLLSTLH